MWYWMKDNLDPLFLMFPFWRMMFIFFFISVSSFIKILTECVSKRLMMMNYTTCLFIKHFLTIWNYVSLFSCLNVRQCGGLTSLSHSFILIVGHLLDASNWFARTANTLYRSDFLLLYTLKDGSKVGLCSLSGKLS